MISNASIRNIKLLPGTAKSINQLSIKFFAFLQKPGSTGKRAFLMRLEI